MSDLEGNGHNIWVDSREASGKPKIVESLQKLGITTHVENLGNAIDYLIPSINGVRHVIQRKSAAEMISPKKAFEDIIQMKAMEGVEVYLLLEGSLGIIQKFAPRMPPHAIIGGIESILLDYNVKIIPSPNTWWTSIWLAQRCKRLGKTKEHKPLSVGETVDREMPLHDQGRRIIETLPNIGPRLAIRIMQKYGTAKNALDNLDSWSLIDGIASGKVHAVREVLNAQWVEKAISVTSPIGGSEGSPSETSES